MPAPKIPADMTEEEVASYRDRTHIVVHQIEEMKAELQEEFGNFTTEVMITGRVLLMPEGTSDENDWFCCYLSDPSADGRLVVDDYCPELWDATGPETPSEHELSS
jgi:hypothetical protein